MSELTNFWMKSQQNYVTDKKLTFHWQKNIQYCDVSVMDNFNLDETFLWVARALSGDNHLIFVEAPALLYTSTNENLQFMCGIWLDNYDKNEWN